MYGFKRRGEAFFRVVGDGVTLVYDKEFISTDEQMDILMEKVIPRLNKMQTQEDLIEEMYCLDKIKFVGEIFWLDSLKLGAFIAAGQNDNAIRVISAHLYQRLRCRVNGGEEWEKTYWTEEDVEKYEKLKLFPEDDEYFTGLFRMVKRNDKEEIRKYLTDNYECNKKYAAFCMKK